MVPWYIARMPTVERVQTGIRLERRTLKVLRALADYLDLSLGDLVEGVVLHAFEGKQAFSAETLAQMAKLCGVYGLTLTARDSHRRFEANAGTSAPTSRTASRSRKPPKRAG